MPLTKIRLSHSAREVLAVCDRKFQIERLLTRDSGPKEEWPVFSRGHSFGKGVQVYLVTGNMDLALYHAWLDYWPELENDLKVTQHRTLHALLCAQGALDELRENWEVVDFNGLPAIELGFAIDIDETYYDVGFLDAALRNRKTGLYATLEVKYTGSKLNAIEPMYKNSGQGTGYSIVLDYITGKKLSDYGTIYFVCQDKDDKPKDIKFHTLPFEHGIADRLKWFISLGLDVDRIKRQRELGVFPMRGHSCLRFNRPCPHFGTCNLHGFDQEREDEIDPHEGRYQFRVRLEDLIKSHMEGER